MHSFLKKLIVEEKQRQEKTLGLIPSENVPSQAVRDAVGSVFMHKYSEGFPGARYYEGNEHIDTLENMAREMVHKVMTQHESQEIQDDWQVNVQVLSGSVANLAVFNAVLQPGDTIVSMYLPDGGHLSHGWNYSPKNEETLSDDAFVHQGSKKVTAVSKIYNVIQYKTDPETDQFNYKEIERIVKKYMPKMLITGGTAYPRDIDYAQMRNIAGTVGAYYLADIAHEAGLVAGGAVPSPFAYADFVTFTTHKTFRGPKGAVAMARKKFANALDRSVMPGLLGGPFNHSIAGILQAAYEIDTVEFNTYARQVVQNARVFAEELVDRGYNVVTGGTDKHLILVRLTNKNISGSYFAKALAEAGIITNMNTVPGETGSPRNPSGIRFGTPLVTTRGMKEQEMHQIVQLIEQVYGAVLPYVDQQLDDFSVTISQLPEIIAIRNKVELLCERFPLFA